MRESKAFAVLTILALILSACSPGEEIAEELLESEGIDDVEIDAESGQVEIEGEGEDGESFSIGGGEIPADFPIDVPSGGEVQSVVEDGEEGLVAVRYEEDFESIKDFYEDWVEDNGEVTNRVEASNPQSVTWSVVDGDLTYAITVADAGVFVQTSLVVARNN